MQTIRNRTDHGLEGMCWCHPLVCPQPDGRLLLIHNDALGVALGTSPLIWCGLKPEQQ